MNAQQDAAHALLDALTAFDSTLGDSDPNEQAVQLALARLNLSDDTLHEARPVIAAALTLLTVTTRSIAEARSIDLEVLIGTVRDHIDTHVYGT